MGEAEYLYEGNDLAESCESDWDEEDRYLERMRRYRERLARSCENKQSLAPKVIKNKPRGSIGEYSCKCCNEKFTARVADRKRGWARFCNKSCSAYYKAYGKKKK